MDPQSLSFTPQSDVWRLSNTMRSFQEVQQDHADRLIRLERRQDDDARMKSVWGSASPFPGVLSGTPQHGPVSQPSGVDFASFDDDQGNNMVRSLHLDADEEPRRLGVGSRANSVRFVDENSKSGQWIHTSRSSVDLLPRTSSGLGNFGGHPLVERTVSHKSDGRQSSAGQSAVSGRANSFLLDNSHPLVSTSTEPPGLAPGLFILGSVPAIIRCWLSTNFKHESLLYAAVCTGSYKSYLDSQLVKTLGLASGIRQDLSGDRKVRVPMYLPEAVPQAASSRSSSPTPQLPSLTVDFTVLSHTPDELPSKGIQIVIGSDILRAHNADILFSSNNMTLYDDERCKLSVPFVRPENDEAFKCLTTSVVSSVSKFRPGLFLDTKSGFLSLSNGTLDQREVEEHVAAAPAVSETNEKPQSISSDNDGTTNSPTIILEERLHQSATSDRYDRKPSLVQNNLTKADAKEVAEENQQINSSSRTASAPAIWSNWRRDGNASAQADWASATRSMTGSYQRTNREQGIKVLKPIRQTSRAPVVPPPASPNVTGQSRFFDEGKRRSGTPSTLDLGEPQQPQGKRSSSGEVMKPLMKESSTPPTPATITANAASTSGVKSRSTNPIGGASAFGWLNSGVQPK